VRWHAHDTEAGGVVVASGRVLAVDWGDKRIGLAVSDELGLLARPLGVIVRRAGKRPPIAELLRRAEAVGGVTRVVFGLPLDPAGNETPRCAEVRAVGATVREHSGLRVDFVDERYTTVMAQDVIHAQGEKVGDRRADIDAIAAAVLLQQVLDHP
jgi:putative holliday junction resolvase